MVVAVFGAAPVLGRYVAHYGTCDDGTLLSRPLMMTVPVGMPDS
jgi:hypothetical protein